MSFRGGTYFLPLGDGCHDDLMCESITDEGGDGARVKSGEECLRRKKEVGSFLSLLLHAKFTEGK